MFRRFLAAMFRLAPPEQLRYMENLHIRGNTFPKAYNGVDLDKECMDMINSSKNVLQTKTAWAFTGIFARDCIGVPCLSEEVLDRLIKDVIESQGKEANSLKLLLNNDTTNPEVYGREAASIMQLIRAYK